MSALRISSQPFALWGFGWRQSRINSDLSTESRTKIAVAEDAANLMEQIEGSGNLVGGWEGNSTVQPLELTSVDALLSQWFLHRDLVRLLFREKWDSPGDDTVGCKSRGRGFFRNWVGWFIEWTHQQCWVSFFNPQSHIKFSPRFHNPQLYLTPDLSFVDFVCGSWCGEKPTGPGRVVVIFCGHKEN